MTHPATSHTPLLPHASAHAAEAESLLSDLARHGEHGGTYNQYLNLTLARGLGAVTNALLAVAAAVQAGASDTADAITGTASRVEDLDETVSLLTEILDPATVIPPRRWPWQWLRRRPVVIPMAEDHAGQPSPQDGFPVDQVVRWDGGEDGPLAGDQVLCRDVWHLARSVEPDPEKSGWTRTSFDDGTSHLAAPGELTVIRRYPAVGGTRVLQLQQLLESGYIATYLDANGHGYSHLDRGTAAGLGEIAARWAAREHHDDDDSAGALR